MNPIKLTVALAFLAAVSAGAISYVKRSDLNSGHGGLIEASIPFEIGSYGGYDGGLYAGEHKDYYAYPKYKFEYGVKDPHTHDHKSQWETRDGDFVKGEYTLDEADGTTRKVSYHADGKTGFHAKVEKIGHAHHAYGHGGFY